MKHLFLALCLLFSSILFAQSLLLENCNIVDVENGKIIPGQTIVIENGVISEITSKKKRKKSDIRVINASEKYVMPGMIDTHIHFFQTGSLYTRPDAIDLTETVAYKDELQFAEELVSDSFKRYLRLGITTVIDVGGPFSNFKIRDEIAENNIAPNVYVTGPLFSPYQPAAFAKMEDVPIEKITTIEEATTLFNKMLPYKPDFIKIWYIANNEEAAQKNFPVVQHIAQLAHKNGLKLAVHATQLSTAQLAVKAGADILVHSVDDKPIPESFAKELKDKNVTYIPTLIVSKNYIKAFVSKPDNHPQDLAFANPKTYRSMTDLKKFSDEEAPAVIKSVRTNEKLILTRYAKTDSLMFANLKMLYDYGVNVAAGTDAGNIGTMHASSYLQELESMQLAGLTVPQILKASTINAAKGFGLDKLLGSVKKGKIADLLVLTKNPLIDLNNLNAIDEVIKDGVALDVLNILKETPEQIVQRQVNAYNARDIDAFMDTYSNDIKIYNFPEILSVDGKEAMRIQFKDMFEKVPNLYCEIKNRIVLDNQIVDREYVRFGEQYTSVIAIYEVEEGKISKVTFLR